LLENQLQKKLKLNKKVVNNSTMNTIAISQRET